MTRESQSELAEPIFTIRRLSVSYGDATALGGVDLDIHRGRITAIIGPSGCGKSSFLNCLNRMTDLLPGCRVDGRLSFEDQDILDRNIDLIALRRRVGMIFQRPNPFPLSIHRNLDLPLKELGISSRRQRHEVIERSLDAAGLWHEVKDRLDSSALALSGGQQQRLCIARALVLEPEVLLFDEPCSALDPISSGIVEDLILKLKEQATILIVTHNLRQARRVADHVAMFWHDGTHGQLLEEGPAPSFFESPRHPVTAAYLDGSRG